jgi:acetylornithine aminotransferase
MGRTGKWFGYEHYNIRPDIIACGKGLGNGYPVSAVGMNKEMARRLEQKDFHHAQSHQNDPLGCAVVKEVIAEFRENSVLERARDTGLYFREELMKLAIRHSCIKEVRGIGLMCTVQFQDTYHEILTDIHRKLYEAGFITGLKPIADVMRFYPPLTIEKQMIDKMITALEDILLSL